MGFSAGCRVSSLTIRNTLGSGCARASASVHPVNFSAAPFRKVTRLSTSVVITASPMLDRVTSYHWRCSCSSRVLRSKASLAATRSRSTCWRACSNPSTFFNAAGRRLSFESLSDTHSLQSLRTKGHTLCMAHMVARVVEDGNLMAGSGIWPLIKTSVASWRQDHASSMGGALAYYTLFSIAPVLIIVIAVARFFLGPQAAQAEIFAQLRGLL